MTQMRAGILSATSTDINDWTNGNQDLDLYINKSWWDIMDQFDFREKEAGPLVFPTVVGTRSYDLSTVVSPIVFDALQRVAIEDINDFKHTDLILMSDFTYENVYVNDTSLESKPVNYFCRNSLIYIYPTPDQIYNISLYYLQVLSDITVTPVIPQAWHEIIESGAKWRALLDKQDYQKADEIRKHQTYLINSRTPVKVKELSDSKYAGVEIPGRDY